MVKRRRLDTLQTEGPIDTASDRRVRAGGNRGRTRRAWEGPATATSGRSRGPTRTTGRGDPGASSVPGFLTTTTGLRQLITFHADGTVLRSVPGEVSGDSTRPPHTAAHGVWRYLGEGRFGVTVWDIFYDFNTGQLLHYISCAST